jgi:hypothetical protein
MTSQDKLDENSLLERLRGDARAIAGPFSLEFQQIGKTRRDARIYGCCDSDGHIRLRLRSRATGEFLKYSSLLATLCHELAHLRHFDHGADFTRLYRRLVRFAREIGLYRPAASGTHPPPLAEGVVRAKLAASAARRRPRRRTPSNNPGGYPATASPLAARGRSPSRSR